MKVLIARRGDFESAMETDSGIFTAPSSGRYEVSFTGLLKSYNGNRAWSTLYKVSCVNIFQTFEKKLQLLQIFVSTVSFWSEKTSRRLSSDFFLQLVYPFPAVGTPPL